MDIPGISRSSLFVANAVPPKWRIHMPITRYSLGAHTLFLQRHMLVSGLPLLAGADPSFLSRLKTPSSPARPMQMLSPGTAGWMDGWNVTTPNGCTVRRNRTNQTVYTVRQ